jgi:ATP-binding cassette, subfamily C (CFTR/MRP), member 1
MDFIACLEDDSLGPSVHGCRDDFDFTLAFEKVFFSLIPASLFIAIALARIALLVRRPQIVDGALLRYVKLVRLPNLSMIASD